MDVVTYQILYTGSRADLPGPRTCGFVTGVHDNNDQLLTEARTTAGFTEACAGDASAQKDQPRYIQYGQFSASVQSFVCV